MPSDDEPAQMKTDDPMFLFTLFQSDIIAAEIDWEAERFVFYPVATIPDVTE